jgi:imidazolonepropionase-like amidohydrolase
MKTIKAWYQKLWSIYKNTLVMAGIGVNTGYWVRSMAAPWALRCIAMVIVAFCSPLALAQTPRPGESKPTEEPAKNDKKEATDSNKSVTVPEAVAKLAKPKKEIVAIVGGDVITVTRERIRKGTILIEDGKIVGLGQDVTIPEGAERIDATGKTITPGFVAISMIGVGTAGGQSSGRLADQLNPFDRNIQLALAVGITTGCLQVPTAGGFGRRRSSNTGFDELDRFPGFDPDEKEVANWISDEIKSFGEAIPLCPCCNLPIIPTEPITPTEPSPIVPQVSSVIKMTYKSLDGMVVKEKGFLDLTPGALTGATNQDAWRLQLNKGKDYLREQAAHEQAVKEGRKVNPPRKPVGDEVLLLLKREIALRIPANRVSEIKELLQLAKEFDYKLVISGCVESWVIPTELAESGASVIITPRTKRQPRFGEESTSGSWIEMPRVLESAGVPFAVQTLGSSMSLDGLAGRDLSSLPLEAAFAVRGGASEAKALASITIVPATMMGLQDRIGSIEVGKDADLLILNGPPLDYRSYVEKAIVNGKLVYDRPVDKILPVYDKN